MFRHRSLPVLLVLAVAACGGEKKDSNTKDDSSSQTDKPAQEADSPTLKAIQVAAGLSASCALMDDGSARCWGRNNLGELGIAASDIDAATPVAIPGVTKAKDIWMGGDTGASGDMVCVRLEDGGITCWGSKRLKPKKDKDSKEKWAETPEALPALAGIKDLALGGGTQYAILPDGSVVGWGSPAFNAFGDGDSSSSDRPLTKIPGVAGATALAAGQNHACALLGDSTVTCWGYVTPKQAPKAIEGLTDVTAIASGSGGSDTCAIKKDGTVHCWSGSQKPKAVEGLSDVKMVRGRTHMCALTGDGSVHCWGSNGRGQIGTGEAGSSEYKPKKVKGLTNAVHIDAGAQTSCAALADGGVQCWGYNQRGQLGDGTLIDRPAPVAVAGVTEKKLPEASDGAEKAQESDVEMDWAGLPKKCKKPDVLEATHPKLKGDFNVLSAYATSSGEGKTVSVDLANFKMDPKKSWDPPRGNQFKLNLRFGKVDIKKKEAKKVDPGSYVLGLKEERKVATSATHKSGGGVMASLSLDGVSPGTTTITHLDDTWICGEMEVKTKNASFKGPYAARLVKK
ncbi:MAG: RCC1 domain-containing protein [Nannocystaceae bacterium]